MTFALVITLILLFAALVQGVINSNKAKELEMKMRGEHFKRVEGK